LVAVTPCDPHLSKVSVPRANMHPGPKRPLRSKRSPRRSMPQDARRPVPARREAGPGQGRAGHVRTRRRPGPSLVPRC
jgi:hypothetical protein